QVLAGSEHGGADPPARGAHERRAQDLETLPDGHRIVQQVVRLLARAGRDVQGDRHGLGAVVRGEVRRQAAGRLNLITHLLSQIPFKKVKREAVKLPKRGKANGYKEPDYPFKFVPEAF